LNNFYQRNTNVDVFSDSNIDLLKISNNQLSRDYLETVHSCGSHSGKATRIVGETFSLVDNVPDHDGGRRK
jgi:hypothetical protein